MRLVLIVLLALSACGCRCTTINLFVEKEWSIDRNLPGPDTHTRIGVTFNGEKWGVQ